MDFTVKKYKELLQELIYKNYTFQTFEEFIKVPKDRCIVLRHDVDLLPENSLVFAKVQADHGIKGVYYFRAVPESWDVSIIKEIESLGHEIGYHYECLTTTRGKITEAIHDFEANLGALRKLASVSTICMHGSPMSRFDSKDLWKEYNYRDYDIIGEPYFDVNFEDVFYLTDTGRRWNGNKVSVRDKVNCTYDQSYRSTDDILADIKSDVLPNRIMFTFHPQRWNDNIFMWTRELLLQNIKNIVKTMFYVKS